MFRKSIVPIALFPVALLFLNVCIGATPMGKTPVVFTNGEELHGSWEGASQGIAAFKGIPFASPPVEDLRWRAPLANRPRSGPQQATAFAPACMQTPYITDWYASVAKSFGFGPETVGKPDGVNEDCLYLNVWSPRLKQDASLPVMIWVHGGSNKGGWSYEPNYMGTKLAAKGVVVVTIAYRLGAFGFFSHPALDNGENAAIANFGMLDVARAVNWVTDNIGSFGGNPQNITLIGESAGAGNISDLLAVEMAKKPGYHRMILQSSASGLGKRRTLADEQATGIQLVNSLGLEGTLTADRLRSIPAEDLLAAYMSKLPGHYFNAVIDQLTMTESPFDTLQESSAENIDVLIGTNADEWFMYIDENAGQGDLDKILDQYPPQQASTLKAEVGQLTDIRQKIDRIETAKRMLCPSRYVAARVTELGGRGWLYHFSRQRPGPGGEKLGAYHGTEIPYVFNMHDDWLPGNDIDTELTAAVMDYWVQFARSGDPNLPNRPAWPVYDRQNPVVMELGDSIGTMKPQDTGLCDVLGPSHQNAERD